MRPRLPEDVLLLTFDQVSGKRDMNTLCQVSKRFNYFLTPRLWRDLVMWARDEQHLEEVGVPAHFNYGGKVEGHIKHTKTIQFLSHFHEKLSFRCLHDRDAALPGAESVDFPHMDQLSDSVVKAIKNIENETLEKFTWGMGTCIPVEVVKHLNHFQKSIKDLSLCTGGLCSENRNDKSPIDFSGLSSLKVLSWSNIHSVTDLSSLRTLIENNREELRDLKLDFGDIRDHDYEYWDNEHENFFASYIIGIPEELPEDESQRIHFPRLEALSIAGVDLEIVGPRLVHAFNFENLTSLSLRDCPGIDKVLKAMIDIHDPNTPFKLTSLEIVCGNEHGWNTEILPHLAFSGFLNYFKFTNLFIDITGPNKGEIVMLLKVLQLQKKSLERFVFHERCFDHFEFEDGMWSRPPAMSLTEHEIDQLLKMRPENYHPFEDLPLKCLGLGCAPDAMRALLIPFTDRKTLKILHMRKSVSDLRDPSDEWYQNNEVAACYDPEPHRTIANVVITPLAKDPLWPFHATKNGEIAHLSGDLFDFLNWLFGPEGVSSLRVFAFGEFSYNGRHRNYNHIFCRREEPIEELRERDEPELNLGFRPIRETDHVLWDLIEKNKDFLGACPSGPLFEDRFP